VKKSLSPLTEKLCDVIMKNLWYIKITFYIDTSGAKVIKLFTAVIYHHSMVMPSFCVIKICYPENYHGMAVNYYGIRTLEKVGLKVPR
jgi:hypothetical protein